MARTDSEGRCYVVTDPAGPALSVVPSSGGIPIPAHDAEVYGYTGSNVTTITYKVGGIAGTTVGTMTITYDGSGNVTSRTMVLP